MNQHSKPTPKLSRNRRGAHTEPSRLEQIEDALHWLSKKVGKLNKEVKEQKAIFADELNIMRKQVKMMGGDDGEEEGEPDPPMLAGDDGEEEGEPDPPMLAGDDGEEEGKPDPPS